MQKTFIPIIIVDTVISVTDFVIFEMFITGYHYAKFVLLIGSHDLIKQGSVRSRTELMTSYIKTKTIQR